LLNRPLLPKAEARFTSSGVGFVLSRPRPEFRGRIAGRIFRNDQSRESHPQATEYKRLSPTFVLKKTEKIAVVIPAITR
jgi:hypothetical protein